MDEATLRFYRRQRPVLCGLGESAVDAAGAFSRAATGGWFGARTRLRRRQSFGWMLAAGFAVRATDGSPEMAEVASRRLGRPVETRCCSMNSTSSDAYDGVWASACLLHVPSDEFAGILARIHRALKASGVFYASFKVGEDDGRDSLGRYYNYVSRRFAARHLRRRRAHGRSLPSDTSEIKSFDEAPADDVASHRAQGLRRRYVLGRSTKGQTILKIASASTAWARKPTVKARVRNTGRPSV